MQRPSLTPITFDDFERPKLNPWDVGLWLFRHGMRHGLRFGIYFAKLAVWCVNVELMPGRPHQSVPAKKVAAAIFVLAVLVAPILFGTCVWLVHNRTHPPGPGKTEPYLVTGVFSEEISLLTEDGLRLSGQYAPAVTAEDVLEGEEVLRRRYPAIILVHDHGEDARQMLPLMDRLHNMGAHVLALDLRGAGRSQKSAQTFGKAERYDLTAAINFLAGRPSVDRDRILVWGIGTGATAAMNTRAEAVPALLVHERSLAEPELDNERFVGGGLLGEVARPMCRWIFRLAYARDLPAGARPRKTVAVAAGDREAAFEEIEMLVSTHLRIARN